MPSNQTESTPRRKGRVWKWVAGISIGFVLICGGLPTLIYFFFLPSKIEMAIGEALPNTAVVVHADYDFVPHDPTHRFVIAFTDDQARDRLIAKYRLQTGSQNIMGSGSSYVASWWPTGLLQQIEQSGECYGSIDDQADQWWTIWVDRNSNLLYFEAGDW